MLFTQDEDLLVLAGKWQEEGRMFSGVAYAHQLRVSIGEAVLSLELIAGVLDPEDAENEVYYFPL